MTVQFARAPESSPLSSSTPGGASGATRIFMTVMRRMLSEDSDAPLHALLLDLDKGRVVGPNGPIFPIQATTSCPSSAR